MSAHLRFAFAGIGFAALALAVLAQEPKPEVKPMDPVRVIGRPGETTLFMMIRTGPHLTPGNLLSTLEEGLSASGCQIEGKPLIRPVSPAVFEELQKITQDTAETVAGAKVAKGIGVSRMLSRDSLWEFRLSSPSQILKKLAIKYRNGEGKEYEKEYIPSGPAEDGPVTLISPGFYSVKLENDVPLKYEAEIVALGQKPESVSGTWPASDRFYVITLRNFRGNKDRLFAALQDEKQVANPLDSIRLGSDLVFVFANVDAFGAYEDDDVFAGNNLRLGAPPPRGRRTARGWVLFPLTESEMKTELKRYKEIKDARELVEAVRKNAIRVNEAAEITPASTPKWIELAVELNGRFQREVPLKDFRGLLEKFPSVFGLVVWEFENAEGMRSAIVMKLPGPGTGTTMVREKEIRNWSNSLREKVNGSK
jgi:hypothetical protein